MMLIHLIFWFLYLGSGVPSRTGFISRQWRCQCSSHSPWGIYVIKSHHKLVYSSSWKRIFVAILTDNKILLVGYFFQALKFLSEFQPNRSKMKEEIGMVISLKTIMHKEGYHSKARQLAKEVYQNIISTVKTPSSRRARRVYIFLVFSF